ncbi:hypothetical protein TNCV_2772751 [Trichonephila clavipes]|nr:hypothetical protein TNCV_2772751 [Trichonephila clavipes]
MAGRRTTLNIDQVRIYHHRKSDEGVIEVERYVISTSDYQSRSFEENRPSLDQSQGFRSLSPSPKENCLGGLSRTTRIDTPDSSPNKRVDNSQSRIKGKDDPVITFPDRINTPDSSPDKKVTNSRSRVRGMAIQSSPSQTKSTLQTVRSPGN